MADHSKPWTKEEYLKHLRLSPSVRNRETKLDKLFTWAPDIPFILIVLVVIGVVALFKMFPP